jgi:O-antigen biosynthesis protein
LRAGLGHDRLRAECDDLRARVDALEARLDGAAGALHQAMLTASLDAHERVAAADFEGDDVLVSLVMPTRERPRHLERAIASVMDQLHERWELIVVDTAGDDATRRVLASVDDPRVAWLDGSGDPPSAARNRGIAAARGDVVAYLDDDNVMLPWWLRAVASAAVRNPGRDVFYGARIHEDEGRTRILYEPFDRRQLISHNLVDTSVLAHRRSVPVRWGADRIESAVDWQLIARLAADGHDPLPIPVRAIVYTTSAPGRITSRPGTADDYERVRSIVRSLAPD